MNESSVKPLIFVTVGTDHHPFGRLMRWIDAWMEAGGRERADVLVQSGTSVPPKHPRWSPYLEREEMNDAFERATTVVCHGGPGTIVEAREHGFVPVVVPRDAGQGEHVDNHQIAFSSRMAGSGEAHVVHTERELHALLNESLKDARAFRAEASTADVDQAVKRFESHVQRLAPRPEPTTKVPVLLIAGVGRSGTTLLERLLGQMSGFCSVGEVVHLWLRGLKDNDLCGCQLPFSECPFWERVGLEAFGGWGSLDKEQVLELEHGVNRHRYVPLMLTPSVWPPYRWKLDRFSTMLADLYTSIRRVSGDRFLVDASKYVSYAYLMRNIPGLDMRVLHLVRDSHGVAYSWTRSNVRRPEVVHKEEYMPTYHPARMAARWTAYNLMYEALPRLGVSTLRLRYESLVSDPTGELKRILRFVDEDPKDHDLSFVQNGEVELEPTHSCSGNPMRFRTGRVPLRHDTEWRGKMPKRDRAVVTALTAPLLSKYGYPVR